MFKTMYFHHSGRGILFRWLTTVIFWVTLYSATVFKIEASVCPPRDTILPCKCANYFNLIECTNITANDHLRQIFTNLKYELDKQRLRPVYDELKLVQTKMEQIGDEQNSDDSGHNDLFAGISFRRISLSRNNRLKRIEPKAFASSFNITTEIMIEDNELLGSESMDTIGLFKALNQFTGLNTLHLTDNGIRFIPKNAFQTKQPALRELFLTDNRIEHIEDYAFTGLDSLQLINLDGNHINQLSLRSLDIDNTTQSLLRIFMRSNKLHTETFPPGIFAYLRRKAYLNLNLNNMTKIPQRVFQSFFKRRSILSVAKNPLKCDCDFKWLLDQGILYNSSNPKGDYLLRDYQCVSAKDDEEIISEVDASDFEHCPQTTSDEQSTIEQCLQQSTDPDQEEFCLNHAESELIFFNFRINKNSMSIMTILLILIQMILSYRLFP